MLSAAVLSGPMLDDDIILEALSAGRLLPACLQGAIPATGEVRLDGAGKSAVVVEYSLPSRDATGHRCACCDGLGQVAIRVFKSTASRATEYRLIEEHINHVEKPGSFVAARYHGNGLRVGDVVHPLVVMEWVAGVPLCKFIKDHQRDGATLRALAASWAAVMHDLERKELAHGDLQPDNIFVVYAADGLSIRLVDYDSVVVPKMWGAVESIFGVPGFSHPRRQELGRKVQHVDVLPALVIYASLLLLADDAELTSQTGAEPRLWVKYCDDTRLLFHQEDFAYFASEKMRGLRALQPGLLDAIQRICEAGPEEPCRFSDEVPRLPEERAGQARQPMRFAPAPTRHPAPSGPSSPIPPQVVPTQPPASPVEEQPLTFGLSPVAGLVERRPGHRGDISPDEAPWFTPPDPGAVSEVSLTGPSPAPYLKSQPAAGVERRKLKVCPQCHAAYEGGDTFCRNDGQPLDTLLLERVENAPTKGAAWLLDAQAAPPRLQAIPRPPAATTRSSALPNAARAVAVGVLLLLFVPIALALGETAALVYVGLAWLIHTSSSPPEPSNLPSASAPSSDMSSAPLTPETVPEPAIELSAAQPSPDSPTEPVSKAELTVISPASPGILVAANSSGPGVVEVKPWQICAYKNRPAAEPGIMEFYGCDGYDPEARWRCEVTPTPDRPTLTVTSCTAPPAPPLGSTIGTP